MIYVDIQSFHGQVLYIMTHDSIGLGEDGPTHQPVEKFVVCRSTPNLQFIRPADVTETAAAYIAAIRKRQGPTVFALSRQVRFFVFSLCSPPDREFIFVDHFDEEDDGSL